MINQRVLWIKQIGTPGTCNINMTKSKLTYYLKTTIEESTRYGISLIILNRKFSVYTQSNPVVIDSYKLAV